MKDGNRPLIGMDGWTEAILGLSTIRGIWLKDF